MPRNYIKVDPDIKRANYRTAMLRRWENKSEDERKEWKEKLESPRKISDSELLRSLIENSSPVPECGCWIYMGPLNWGGYGAYSGKPVHRIVYQMMVGTVPPKMDLDHLCRVRCCINPLHLEPVSRSVNCKRGLTGKWKRK